VGCRLQDRNSHGGLFLYTAINLQFQRILVAEHLLGVSQGICSMQLVMITELSALMRKMLIAINGL
jgi:hypothetical protein